MPLPVPSWRRTAPLKRLPISPLWLGPEGRTKHRRCWNRLPNGPNVRKIGLNNKIRRHTRLNRTVCYLSDTARFVKIHNALKCATALRQNHAATEGLGARRADAEMATDPALLAAGFHVIFFHRICQKPGQLVPEFRVGQKFHVILVG